MNTLVEMIQWVDHILRLDLETPVRGFDGKEIGPSNEQALALASRTAYLKNRCEEIQDALKALTYEDVGAEKLGDIKKALAEHVASFDPHEQYLTKERASKDFVDISTGNKPNGYIQLDEKGYIPADIAKLYEARYEIINTEEERLKLPPSKNLTLAIQLDENRIYYLNSDTDPSVKENWKEGRTTDLSDVVSVFGRAGIITAETGDYNADQITETPDRVFVTPEQKTNWESKQPALESGKNIKSINKTSLLGEGDVEISPETIGAANKNHKHKPSDIETDDEHLFITQSEKELYAGKQSKLVSGESLSTVFGQSLLTGKDITLDDVKELSSTIRNVLAAGDNVDITLNKETGLITIDVKKTDDGGSGTGGETGGNTGGRLPKLIVKDEIVKTTGLRYAYRVNDDFKFDFIAYALEKIIIEPAKTEVVAYTDTTKGVVRTKYPTANSKGYFNGLTFKPTLGSKTGKIEKYQTTTLAGFSENNAFLDITIADKLTTVMPVFTAENMVINGFSLQSSKEYSGFSVFKAFQSPLTASQKKRVDNYDYWSDAQIWKKRTGDVYIEIIANAATVITGYGFQNFESLYWSSLSTPPTAWKFQGRNKESEAWITLDTQKNQTIMKSGDTWSNYALAKPVSYKRYRLLIDDVALETARTSIPRFQLYNEPYSLIKSKQGDYYTIDDKGELSKLTNPDYTAFASSGFKKTVTPINLKVNQALFPAVLCSLVSGSVTGQYYKQSQQIAIQKSILPSGHWEALRKIEVTKVFDESDKTDILVAVTLDGSRYFSFQNNVWGPLGQITADSTSALKIIEKGMLFLELVNITKDQWMKLHESAGVDENAKLGIAYASNVSHKNDKVTPKEINVSFDDIIEWLKVSSDIVEISIAKKDIIFKAKKAGTFKFCYRFI